MPNINRKFSSSRLSALIPYGGASLAVWVALALWTMSPALHREPFALFLAAVVVTARFFGFGPALFASAVSTVCLDLMLFPRFRMALHSAEDLERLTVFLVIAILVVSLTRQKTQAELRAEKSMREMAAIVECSDDAIFSTNRDGVILTWNRGAEHLYGYRAEEAVGSSVLILAAPDRKQESERNRQVLNQGGRVDSYETERIRKDGLRVPVLLSISPLRNRRGEIVGASVIARDISAQKQSEEAIRRTEKLATAGRLAASVAHEINNPLEAVLNLLYLARNDPKQAERYLSIAEGEVNRVANLAQQALGFVRDTGVPGPVNPAVLMDEVLRLYGRKLDAKRIQVARRYREDCEIVGYSSELRQLLANLLVNAVDAMETGGTLQIRVEPGREWSHSRGGVWITVADNGSGIPTETLEHIFEPFYTTKKEAGTGLGLWISQGIVQKHGGSIRVRSRVDGHRSGTVFRLFLPYARETSQVA